MRLLAKEEARFLDRAGRDEQLAVIGRAPSAHPSDAMLLQQVDRGQRDLLIALRPSCDHILVLRFAELGIDIRFARGDAQSAVYATNLDQYPWRVFRALLRLRQRIEQPARHSEHGC